jgi:hypothetical protein
MAEHTLLRTYVCTEMRILPVPKMGHPFPGLVQLSEVVNPISGTVFTFHFLAFTCLGSCSVTHAGVVSGVVLDPLPSLPKKYAAQPHTKMGQGAQSPVPVRDPTADRTGTGRAHFRKWDVVHRVQFQNSTLW